MRVNQSVINALQHQIDFLQNFLIREAQKPESGRSDKSAPFGVVGQMVGVLAAVELDNQSTCDAGEIGDVWADRVLPAEFESIELAVL